MELLHSYNNRFIDFTVLNLNVNSKQLKNAARVALTYECTGFCIQANAVSVVKKVLEVSKTKLVVVPNWVLGGGLNPNNEWKLSCCKEADEVDYVIDVYNTYELKDWNKVANDIHKVKKYSKILKVILELNYLRMTHFNERTKLMHQAVDISIANGADWVKTDSGLYSRQDHKNTVGGISLTETAFEGLLDDTISLIKYSKVPVKCAGGIRTKEQTNKLIDIGVKRIGTSSFEVIK